jgi:peptide/nickel transport system substrate-binding protein
MRRRTRVPLASLLVVLVLLVAAACTGGNGGGDGGDGDEDGSLTVGFVAEPANLDFTTTEGAAIPQALLVNVYEGLVKLDQDGEIVPLLASEWEVSDDNTTYTFTLREGVTFTNGAEFTAEDVVFSIERVQTESQLEIAAQMDVVAGVEATGDHTVVVTLERPSNDFLHTMAATRLGAMFSRTGTDDLANTPVGTGPYEVSQWRRGDAITLTTREGYWGEEPRFGEVTLRYFSDPTAMNNALLSGGIDVISSVQAPETLEQFSGGDYQVVEGTTNGEVVMAFNNGRPPLDDVRVRQAIRHAIDHQALLDTAWAGYGELIGSMVPPTDPWHEDLTGTFPHDPARAQELLAEAGAEDFSLRLRIPNLPYATAAAQVVQSQLAEVGITAEIEPLEFPAVWLDVVFEQADYDMSIINHVEPRDMSIFANPDYYFRWDNAEYQDLLERADAGTESEQVALLQDAARLLSEESPADFLWAFPNLMVAVPGITGLPSNLISESFDLTGLSRS